MPNLRYNQWFSNLFAQLFFTLVQICGETKAPTSRLGAHPISLRKRTFGQRCYIGNSIQAAHNHCPCSSCRLSSLSRILLVTFNCISFFKNPMFQRRWPNGSKRLLWLESSLWSVSCDQRNGIPERTVHSTTSNFVAHCFWHQCGVCSDLATCSIPKLQRY